MVKHDTKSIVETLKKFYSNQIFILFKSNLLAKPPKSPNRYKINFSDYYTKLAKYEDIELESTIKILC